MLVMQGKPLFLCRSRVLADPNLAIGAKSWFDPDKPCSLFVAVPPEGPETPVEPHGHQAAVPDMLAAGREATSVGL